jgi:hypothetical protein
LIDYCRSLKVFRAQTSDGMSKNQICQHTGVKNKGPILLAIDLMAKEKILDSKRVNKQKKLITLAPLGSEIIDFITDIGVTNEAYFALGQKIAEYVYLREKCQESAPHAPHDNDNSEKLLRSILLQKGWKNEELDSFEDVVMSLHSLRNVYLKNISNSLLHRYFTISSKFKMNYIANAVLVRVLVDGITNLLNIGPVQNILQPSVYRSNFEDLQTPVLNDIKQAYHTSRQTISNRFTSEEITGLMSSLICVLKPSPDKFSRFTEVISEIEKEKNRIESNKKTYKKYSKVAGRKTLLSEEEIEQLEHNGQWKRVKAEILKRFSHFTEKGAECALYNLEELAKVHRNCLKRFGELFRETM